MAQELVAKLRTGLDIPALLRYANGVLNGTLSHQPVALLPSAESPFEMELMVRHRAAYQMLDMEVDLAYAGRLVNTAAGEPRQSSVNAPSRGPSDFISTVLNPAPRYYDDRLARLRIGFWTAVRITDDMAAAALSHYFEVEHLVLGLFDADLFIDDLVNQRIDYCSPFLVSAVLTFALVSLGHAVTKRKLTAGSKHILPRIPQPLPKPSSLKEKQRHSGRFSS